MRKLKNSELNRISIDDFKGAIKVPIVVVLDNIRSLNNVGSVFRTSDAFLLEKIYLCGITATPPHNDIHKTALGAEESMCWEYGEDTVEVVKQLQKEGYNVLAIEQAVGAQMLDTLELNKDEKYAIVMGNEVKGVQQCVIDACNGCVEIPQYGTKHSLNVSVTTGVVIWEMFKKMSL